MNNNLYYSVDKTIDNYTSFFLKEKKIGKEKDKTIQLFITFAHFNQN